MITSKYNTNDLAYTAGLLDGEGCIYITRMEKRHVLMVTITNTVRDVLVWTASLFGGSIHDRTQSGSSPWSVWTIRGPSAANFLSSIRPWMKIKAQQAWLACEYDAQRAKGLNRANPLTDEELALRDGFRFAIKDANKSYINT